MDVVQENHPKRMKTDCKVVVEMAKNRIVNQLVMEYVLTMGAATGSHLELVRMGHNPVVMIRKSLIHIVRLVMKKGVQGMVVVV